MARQNRVDPFGMLHEARERGTLMGNRGGRFHDGAQRLGARRWVSKAWITCLCEFKGRKREVWGNSYTELFFLDEVTAFSAGHRPCFECRRIDAKAFQAAFPNTPNALQMDALLHGERLNGAKKRLHMMQMADLPDGTMIAMGGAAFAVRGDKLMRWSFGGYIEILPRFNLECLVLTPPSTVAALGSYKIDFHASAALL